MSTSKEWTTVMLPPGQLVPNPENPNAHPPEQIQALVASLKLFGQSYPAIARKQTKMIISGHGLTQAAIEAGLELIEVKLWDVDETKALAYLVADNQLARLSVTDEDCVKSILMKMDADWLPAMGFGMDGDDDREGEASVQKNGPAVEDVDTSLVTDKFYLSIQGPLELQDRVLAVFKAIERECPEIIVELGTIASD